MVKYNPLVQKTSRLPEFSEVNFTIRRISHGIRSRIRLELSASLGKIREKTDLITELVDEGKFVEPPAFEDAQMLIPLEEGLLDSEPVPIPIKAEGRVWTKGQIKLMERISDVNNEIEIITATEVDPVYLKHGLVSFTGIDIEGKKPFWQAMYEDGPEDLCQEILIAIKSQAGLTSETKENLESPSTSGAQVGGANPSMIAPDASTQDGTQAETVKNISLVK